MAFIPENDKNFAFKEGDIITSYDKGRNSYNVTKFLKIEKAELKRGEIRNIAGQNIEIPEDDFFLIVAVKMTGFIYPTLVEAKTSVANNKIDWKFMHLPMRPSGWKVNLITLEGHEDVTDAELELYYEWKKLFDKGEAGVW